MKNSWLAKIMFLKEGTGLRLTGLASNHPNSFHVSEILGMSFFFFLEGKDREREGFNFHCKLSLTIYMYV
jgi:hypothetical protein